MTWLTSVLTTKMFQLLLIVCIALCSLTAVKGCGFNNNRGSGGNPGGGSSQLCMSTLCSGTRSNTIRGCDNYGCGHYGASRGPSRSHNGVDIECSAGATVYAPFPGTVERNSIPYSSGKQCCNYGLLLRGSGAWQDYEAKIWYTRPDSGIVRSTVSAGQRLGYHTSLICQTCYDSGMTDHVHIEVRQSGTIVDPTTMATC